jgi:hypothetical protein
MPDEAAAEPPIDEEVQSSRSEVRLVEPLGIQGGDVRHCVHEPERIAE